MEAPRIDTPTYQTTFHLQEKQLITDLFGKEQKIIMMRSQDDNQMKQWWT